MATPFVGLNTDKQKQQHCFLRSYVIQTTVIVLSRLALLGGNCLGIWSEHLFNCIWPRVLKASSTQTIYLFVFSNQFFSVRVTMAMEKFEHTHWLERRCCMVPYAHTQSHIHLYSVIFRDWLDVRLLRFWKPEWKSTRTWGEKHAKLHIGGNQAPVWTTDPRALRRQCSLNHTSASHIHVPRKDPIPLFISAFSQLITSGPTLFLA